MSKLTAIFLITIFIFPMALFPVREARADATVIYLTDTEATTWTVPSDWNNLANTIEVIGGGGGGSGYAWATNDIGGGGGAYAKITNVTLSAGVNVGVKIGSGGAGATGFPATGVDGSDTYLCDSSSNCASISGSAVIVGAKGGKGAGNTGAGGAAADSVGTVKYSGGHGGIESGSDRSGGGGGGAGGPNGNGGNGGDILNVGANGGAGGGGNGGGADGTDSSSTNSGQNGGNNYLGAGGGGECSTGTAGGGGGGGSYAGCGAGDGGIGQEWDSTHGSGGGGGGQAENQSNRAGAGGLYGGGGGGGGAEGTGAGGNGAQGIIVITYTPSSRSSLSRPANNLGLVAYFPFNEGTSFSTGDFSGKGYVGTLSGSTVKPAWVFGKFGKALQFVTGTDNYVTVPAPDTDFLGPLSISSWVKFTSNGGAIAGKLTANGGTNNAFDFQVFNNDLYFVRANTSYCIFYTATAGITTNTWHHVAVTTSSGDITTTPIFYIDGVAATAQTGSCDGTGNATGIGNPIRIGRRDDGEAQAAGIIDEVRIYNRQISSSEVSSLAKAKSTIVGGGEKSKVKTGLVGLWTFNGNDMAWSSASAGTAYDRSGQGNDGTLVGMNQAINPVNGKLGQSLYFDGSQTVSMGSDLVGTGDASTCAWINMEGVVGSTNSIFDSLYYEMAIYYSSPNYYVLVTNNNNNSYLYQLPSSPLNVWKHLCVTRQSGGTAALYIDGNYVGEGSAGTPASAFNLEIGGRGASHLFKGKIDDARIYNRILSASEIKQLYRMGSGGIIRNN